MVDEAVVATDRVAQRLRQRDDGRRSTDRDAVARGLAVVRSPLMYATLIVLLAVVPVAVMDGRPGEFFGPLVVAYVAAVAAAMLVALTLDPGAHACCCSSGGPAGRHRLADTCAARCAATRPRCIGRAGRWIAAVGGAVVLARGRRCSRCSARPRAAFKDRDVLVRLDAAAGDVERRR